MNVLREIRDWVMVIKWRITTMKMGVFKREWEAKQAATKEIINASEDTSALINTYLNAPRRDGRVYQSDVLVRGAVLYGVYRLLK